MDESCLGSIFRKARSLSLLTGFPKPVDISAFDRTTGVFDSPPNTILYCGSGEQFAEIPEVLLEEAFDFLGYRSLPRSFLRTASRSLSELYGRYSEAPAMAVVTTAYCHPESLFPFHFARLLSVKPVFRGLPVALLGAYGTKIQSRDFRFAPPNSDSLFMWESRRLWVREGVVAFDEWEQTVSTLPWAIPDVERTSLVDRLSRYQGAVRRRPTRPEYIDSPGIGFTRLLPQRDATKASRVTLWITLQRDELRCLEVSMTSCEFTEFLPMNYRIDWDQLATTWGI